MKIIDKKNMIKSIVYRIYSFVVTFLIAFVVTGDIKLSITLGLVENVLKIATYYWFDVIWDKFTNKKYSNSVIWLTGLSGSGKTTIAKSLLDKLKKEGKSAMILDGDEIRDIFKNTGFDKEARIKHNQDVGKMAVYLQSQGIIPIVSLISPYAEARDYVRSISNGFLEVYINTSIEECEKRDVKGLYKKVREGVIKDFTGIHESSPYEIPKKPELILETVKLNVDECVNEILKYIKK